MGFSFSLSCDKEATAKVDVLLEKSEMALYVL